jgi:hypothetical protein
MRIASLLSLNFHLHLRLVGVHFPTVAAFSAAAASLSTPPRRPHPELGIRISQETVTAITVSKVMAPPGTPSLLRERANRVSKKKNVRYMQDFAPTQKVAL